MNNENTIKYSILIPAYNEEKIIGEVIIALQKYLSGVIKDGFEIIVVNDGSSDNTESVLKNIMINNYYFVSNPYNKGYGASLKVGAKKSQGKYVIFFDGDNQHKPEDVIRLIENKKGFDMVVGERVGYKGPMIRQPGKRFLKWFASYLVEFKIPDLNSGLRLVKKEMFNRYEHLYPNNFSLTTTITMAFLKDRLNVKYIPIKINKRVGKSTVSPKDAARTLMLITRISTLFSPMKVFLPVSLFFTLLTIISFIKDVRMFNITDTSVMLFVATLLFFFFGIIVDQVAALRRSLK